MSKIDVDVKQEPCESKLDEDTVITIAVEDKAESPNAGKGVQELAQEKVVSPEFEQGQEQKEVELKQDNHPNTEQKSSTLKATVYVHCLFSLQTPRDDQLT